MNATDVVGYAYEAAVHCPDCARARFGAALDDSDTADTEGNPIGAMFADGEADSPQHCDDCGAFIPYRLTGDGYAYLVELVEAWNHEQPKHASSAAVLRQWVEHYEIDLWQAMWNMPGCLPEMDPCIFASAPGMSHHESAEQAARRFLAESLESHADDMDSESAQHVRDAVAALIRRRADAAAFNGYVYSVESVSAAEIFGAE